MVCCCRNDTLTTPLVHHEAGLTTSSRDSSLLYAYFIRWRTNQDLALERYTTRDISNFHYQKVTKRTMPFMFPKSAMHSCELWVVILQIDVKYAFVVCLFFWKIILLCALNDIKNSWSKRVCIALNIGSNKMRLLKLLISHNISFVAGTLRIRCDKMKHLISCICLP